MRYYRIVNTLILMMLTVGCSNFLAVNVEEKAPSVYQAKTIDPSYLQENNTKTIIKNGFIQVVKKYYSAAGHLCTKTTVFNTKEERVNSKLHCNQ